MHKNWQTCGHELPTNLQNFTQKESTEVKIFQKVLWWLLFSETLYRPVYGRTKQVTEPSVLTQRRHKEITKPHM